MSKISGNIIFSGESLTIPEGCVVFIYLMQDEKVIGHQTLSKLEQFPFEYTVEVEDEPLSSNDYSIRVTVEQGESILYANTGVKIEKGMLPSRLDIAVSELKLR